MPEGHSIHRLAGAFRDTLAGEVLHASSPQGRFAAGAAVLDGQRMCAVMAHGKHLFLGFSPAVFSADEAPFASSTPGQFPAVTEMVGELSPADQTPGAAPLWLHVHLGIYGSWRFTGDAYFNAPHIVGAPRRPAGDVAQGIVLGQDGDTRRKTGNKVKKPGGNLVELQVHQAGDASKMIAYEEFADRWFLSGDDTPFVAPDPIGAVRLRLLSDHGVADLSGPNTCELLDPAGVQAVLDRLGPDPLRDSGGFADFAARCKRRKKPIGEAVMDQAVLAGVGNIYRAEVLFAARLSPHIPTMQVSHQSLKRVWEWLVAEMPRGVDTGRVTTMNPDDYAAHLDAYPQAAGDDPELADPVAARYYVYQREGRICLRCGHKVRLEIAAGRKLYYCPGCQK